MIKTLTLHNNDTTPRHNGVGPTHGPHSIVPLLCSVSVWITPLVRFKVRFLAQNI
jgi:hypothetical protein